MTTEINSEYLNLLKDRVNLREIPFSERGSRLLIFQANDSLTVRLAERWFKREGQLSAYRKRPPLIDQWVFTDGEGDPLKLKLTSHPHRIDCETRIGTFSLVFVDAETVLITLPSAHCTIKFNANLDKIQTDRRGGVLRLTGDIRRNVAYTTNARIVSHATNALGTENQSVHLHLDATEGGKALLLNITPRLGFNRYIPEVGKVMENAAQRWHEWFANAPQVEEEYRAQYYYAWWIMRAGLISTRFYTTREAMTPSMIHYVGVWQWDAYFHALAYRHLDKHLAQDQIRIVLDHQREDGMIPDAIHDEGLVTRLDFPVAADVTKPPLLAWAAYKLYEHDGDREFLDEIYEPIVRSNNWWFAQNDVDGNGLCEYHHPFSSGLDDSPLWDEGMPVESPDLNTYLYLQQEALAKIASVIGKQEDVELWRGRAQAMAGKLVERAWDAESGFFWARKNGTRVNVRTPFNLFPLITGQLPSEISDRLVAHLTDERQFWSRYPVPTVAMDDPKYNPAQMWRGPTWVNVNYLLIEGLQRSGYQDLARELRRRTLDLIGSRDDIYEYYDPVSGQNPPNAASMFGWSSAVFIDLAIQATREKLGMTNVALLHYSAPPIVGGVESVLGHHARLMADAGHQVQIVAGRGEQTDLRIPFIHLPLADSRHPEVLALKAELDAGHLPTKFNRLADSLTANFNEILDDTDVLIAHNVCSLNKNLALTAAVRNLANYSHLRIILWHHDLAWTTPRYRAELHDGYPWDLLRQAWPDVKQVTISEMRQHELAELFQINENEIAVVPNGVDFARFYKLEEQTQEYVKRLDLLNAYPLLLLPVRITPRKNIELALSVCERLINHFPDAKLVVTGPLGPHNPANVKYFDKLDVLRKVLKLEQIVHFLADLTAEYISDEVISDFYHLADALFLPSREEGFGIPILEAGLAGLPIFCSDIPPLRSLGGSYVTYFSPDAHPSGIAEIIAKELSSSPLSRMRAEVRRQYTWERIYTQKIAPLLVE